MKKLVTVMAFGLCAASTVAALADAASVVNSRSSTSITNSVDSSTSSSIRNSVRSNNVVTNNSSINSNGSNSSIVANDGATVSNSTMTDVGGTSTQTNSIVGRTGSMCSAVVEGKRCDIQCRAPQVAQCGKAIDASEPSCLCQ